MTPASDHMTTNIAALRLVAVREHRIREKRVDRVTQLAVDGSSDSHERFLGPRHANFTTNLTASVVDEPLGAVHKAYRYHLLVAQAASSRRFAVGKRSDQCSHGCVAWTKLRRTSRSKKIKPRLTNRAHARQGTQVDRARQTCGLQRRGGGRAGGPECGLPSLLILLALRRRPNRLGRQVSSSLPPGHVSIRQADR
jgi:hypothetical protein